MADTLQLESLLNRLAPVAYSTLCRYYKANCCIAAAVILSRVLKERGYKAEAIPVSMEVYNAAMVKLLAEARIPSDLAERRALFDQTGAWGVGIIPASVADRLEAPPRIDRRNGGYNGHLLLKIDQYLVDPTIRQAERPEKDIVLPELIYTSDSEPLFSKGLLVMEINGCHVVYRLLDDHSYRASVDWKRRSQPYPETVRTILEKIA